MCIRKNLVTCQWMQCTKSRQELPKEKKLFGGAIYGKSVIVNNEQKSLIFAKGENINIVWDSLLFVLGHTASAMCLR